MADDPRKALKQIITDILAKIQDLELTVSDFNGDQELLQNRVNLLVQELQRLQSLSSSLDYRLPKELLGFLDKGGNPDSYTGEVFARANRANQFSKGKVKALQTFRQAAALLQLVNAMAGGRDVGTAVTITCQTVIKGEGHAAISPAVKRLAYNIVRGGALTDADWDNVLAGFLRDTSPSYPSTEVQIAALEILPCIPPHKLRSLMASDTSFPATLTRQMATSVKDVAAAAIAALGACLSDPLTSDQLATTKGIAATARAWAGLVAEALLDPSQLLAAAACSAARPLLSSTGVRSLEPGGELRHLVAMEISLTMLKNLPELLHKGRALLPEGQVSFLAALSALVEFLSKQPVFPAPQQSEGLQPTGGDLLVLAEAAQAPSPPGTATSGAGWVVVEQIGYYFQSCLGSVFPPLALEAASSLLKICRLETGQPSAREGSELAVATAWAPLALATLIELWDKRYEPSSGASHTQLLSLIASSIKCLQASGQLELAGEVVPLLAKIPSAEARTQAQAHVWGAVVELDLATRAARRCGEKGIPAVELRNTLTHPFVLDCISAKNEEEFGASYPAFREEVVCTLVETLLSHPQGVVHGLEEVEGAEEGGGGLVGTMKAGARAQAAGSMVDWLGTAKIALQGTKACLGWDRDPVEGTYACTAVTDSWLLLLQRCLHAARALQAAGHTERNPLQGTQRLQGQNSLPAQQSHRGVKEGGAVAEAARVAASYVGALQELLDQLLMHWQALSSAVQPRALWLAAHHYELAPTLDPGWAHLLQGLSTSLGVHDDDAKTRRKQSLKSAAAAGQMRPWAGEEHEGLSSSPIDEAEICSEAMAVGLVAADRLASLLLHNAEVGPRPGLKEISAGLVAILQPVAAPTSSAGPQSREQAARIVTYLTPMALAPAPTTEAGEALAVQTAFGAKLLPNPNWPVDEGFPMAGPSGATLQSTKRGSRYWALRSQVQTAIAAASGRSDSAVHPAGEPHEAVGILEVLALIGDGEEMGGGTILTAPNDPLRLTVWHTLEAGSSRASLQFEAYNQLDTALQGVAIRLGLGGPIVPEAKQPPAYKLAMLPARDSVRWRFTVRITGFGRTSVQPFVSLPVEVPLEAGDSASLRCQKYEMPLTVLLSKPQTVPTPALFFQAWPSLAQGVELTGVCRNRGAVGGLQALTALETVFSRVSLQPLPAQGGFHAAYAGEALGGFKLGMVISGQLLPVGLPPPRVHSGGHVATGHVVCRMCVRSTDPQVVHVLSKEAARWIQEVFGRTMVEGTNADGLLGPAAPFKISQSLIPVERLYAAGTHLQGEAVEGELTQKKDKADAVTREWHRIRMQRMGVAM